MVHFIVFTFLLWVFASETNQSRVVISCLDCFVILPRDDAKRVRLSSIKDESFSSILIMENTVFKDKVTVDESVRHL